MNRYWASWWSGNYEDEGCTKPPFNFWNSGQRDRRNADPESERDECSLCAIIDAEDENTVEAMIRKHYPDYQMRFCQPKASDWQPASDRFPPH